MEQYKRGFSTIHSIKYDIPNLNISDSYLKGKREPNKNQIAGSALEYLYDFILWCFYKPMKSYRWDKNSRYCESIKCNCKICKLTEDKENCTLKYDVERIKLNELGKTKLEQ